MTVQFGDYLFLRIALAVTLFSHSFFSILSGDVYYFGKLYLDTIGFAPYGVVLAWMVKLVHLVSCPLLLLNRGLLPIAVSNILILIMGIILVHGKEGWFVVGGGSNGIEYNVLLIFCFLQILNRRAYSRKKND
jgi:putative oxidoreductase